jgi:hypothetical protein
MLPMIEESLVDSIVEHASSLQLPNRYLPSFALPVMDTHPSLIHPILFKQIFGVIKVMISATAHVV